MKHQSRAQAPQPEYPTDQSTPQERRVVVYVPTRYFREELRRAARACGQSQSELALYLLEMGWMYSRGETPEQRAVAAQHATDPARVSSEAAKRLLAELEAERATNRDLQHELDAAQAEADRLRTGARSFPDGLVVDPEVLRLVHHTLVEAGMGGVTLGEACRACGTDPKSPIAAQVFRALRALIQDGEATVHGTGAEARYYEWDALDPAAEAERQADREGRA